MNPNQQTINKPWQNPDGGTHECEITIGLGDEYTYGEDADGNRGEVRQDWKVVGTFAEPPIEQDHEMDFDEWCDEVKDRACLELVF